VKIIFFGTGNISKYFLENINSKHTVCAVVTMCDKPVARGRNIKPPIIKTYAIEKNIPYIQVDKFNDDIAQQIKNYNADVGVVVSFGKIIPEKIFTIPFYGCFNIHFSLLPKYRGASPVQQALIDGEKITGVTAFYIEKGLDTGNILLQESLEISNDDTSETLFNKLNVLGISVQNKALDMLESGNCIAKKQEGNPTFCKIFKKEDGKIDWNSSATKIYDLYRGLYLWPGIFCKIKSGKLADKTLKIIECKVYEDKSLNKDIGVISSIQKGIGFTATCKQGSILVLKVQPESKSKMSAYDFINGYQLKINDQFI
jgi:methionyl-tRNA formyltransferase